MLDNSIKIGIPKSRVFSSKECGFTMLLNESSELVISKAYHCRIKVRAPYGDELSYSYDNDEKRNLAYNTLIYELKEFYASFSD